MKKILLSILAVSLIMTACSDDDDDKKPVEEPVTLEKSKETIDAEANELNIKAEGNLNWNISEVVYTDSAHIEPDTIIPSSPIDTIRGEWFTVIKGDDGEFLKIKVDENKEEVRTLNVEISTGTDSEEFDLTQNGIDIPE